MDPDAWLREALGFTPPGLPAFAPNVDDVIGRVRRRRVRRRTGAVAVGLILALGISLPLYSLTGLGGGTRQPAAGAQNGRIAYTLFLGSKELIYSVDPDGSDATRLSDGQGLDQAPVWSPDGTRIAFTGFRPPIEGESPNIFVMNRDGEDVRLLVANGFDPSWSPDGSKLAFSREARGDIDIYVVNADGSGLIRLTDDPARDVSATWSPDGRKLAFVKGSDGSGFGALYVMNTDGTDVQQIFTGRPVADAAWSPRSDEIVFESPRGLDLDGPTDINAIRSDGTGLVALTDDRARDLSPDWSPDGTKVVFSSDREGARSIFVMNADGTTVTRLTFGPGEAAFPSWGAAEPIPSP